MSVLLCARLDSHRVFAAPSQRDWPIARQLAAVARTAGHRCGADGQSTDQMGPRHKHQVEGPCSGRRHLNAHHLGGQNFPSDSGAVDGRQRLRPSSRPMAAKAKARPPGKGPPGKGKGDFGPKGEFGKGPPPGKGGKGGMGGPPPTEPYQFTLLCLDRKTGKTLWSRICREEVPHEGFRPGDGSFAAASAMTDGENVFAFFGSRGLYCLDMSGNVRWQKDFGRQQTRQRFWRRLRRPRSIGNTIVVQWDHDGGSGFVWTAQQTHG